MTAAVYSICGHHKCANLRDSGPRAGFLRRRRNLVTRAFHCVAVAEALPHLADLMLVDRCMDGEQAAARELFRAHQGRVHATLFRVLGANRDMDDLMQETFIQVFRSLKSFRGEARLATWIDRIAARVAYRYLAQKKGMAAPVALEEEVAGPG